MNYFSRKILKIIILCALLVQPFLSLPVKLDAATSHVYPGQSIQDAIDAAGSGDTIEVQAGTYMENLYIDKNLTFIGENKFTTIIDGSMNGLPAIAINASAVSLMNFTIQNATIGISIGSNVTSSASILQESKGSMTSIPETIIDELINSDKLNKETEFDGFFIEGGFGNLRLINCEDVGISAWNAHGLNVDDCTFSNGDVGIYLHNSNNAELSNTHMSNMGVGVYFYFSNEAYVDNADMEFVDIAIFGQSSYYNTFYHCDASNCGYGCVLWRSYYNTLTHCSANDNVYDGLVCEDSDYNRFEYYTASGNGGDGMYWLNSFGCQAYECTAQYNALNGFYGEGCASTYLGSCEFGLNDVNGAAFEHCPNSLVTGCTMNDNDYDGIFVVSSNDFNVYESVCEDNTKNGISFEGCDGSFISRSKFWWNKENGAKYYKSGGYVVNTHFVSNSINGIDSYRSRIIVSWNNIHNNGVYGIRNRWYNLYPPPNYYWVSAYRNWWGCPLGPYHIVTNPSALGDQISDYVHWYPHSDEIFIRFKELIAELEPVIFWLHPIVVLAGEGPFVRVQSHENFNPSTRINVDFDPPLSVHVDEVQQVDWRVIYPDQVTPKPLGCSAAWTSDWLASAFFTTKLSDYLEGLDTNSSFVNQTTGKAIGDNGTEIVTFGGPFVNPVVKRAENTSTPDSDRAPVKFHSESGTFYFQYLNGTNIPNASLPASVINHDQDLFVIERFKDSDGRTMTISYGFGWPGTYAAGKYFDQVVYPDLETFIYRWIIVKWEDTNGDGFVNNPDKGDTYTLIATS